MNHFTDDAGYKAIASQVDWTFLASKPPGDHPIGANFTTLGPETPNLANRLRIPRTKLSYRLSFAGADGLMPLEGGRGMFILYSPSTYVVVRERQESHGETGL